MFRIHNPDPRINVQNNLILIRPRNIYDFSLWKVQIKKPKLNIQLYVFIFLYKIFIKSILRKINLIYLKFRLILSYPDPWYGSWIWSLSWCGSGSGAIWYESETLIFTKVKFQELVENTLPFFYFPSIHRLSVLK